MIELEPQPIRHPITLDAITGDSFDEDVWCLLMTWLPPKPGMVPKLINGKWVWVESDQD